MGTRAVITFIDPSDYGDNYSYSYSIYQHWGGDPETVLANIEATKTFAWELPRFEAGDFAAAYVRAVKEGGGNIYLTKSAESHGDLSYRYEVRCVDGKLEVKSFMADGECADGEQKWRSVEGGNIVSWKPEVFVQGNWSQNSVVFSTEAEALRSARDLMDRWMLVEDCRAVPSEDPVNYQIVDNVLSAVKKEKQHD